jgi:epsilon-lactone hydrolase
MPSSKSLAVSTLMRIVAKPSFATMHEIDDLRSGAARWFDRVSRMDSGIALDQARLSSCDVDWVYPEGIESDRVILYIPGGAFVVRTPGPHRALAGRIARAAHARALVVFYRLAPEHPFPAALDDCVEAYETLVDQGVPPARIVMGGDSAGGCLALAALQLLRDRGRQLPAAAFALSPITDLRSHKRGSRTRNEHVDPMLSALHKYRLKPHELYVNGNRKLLENPLVSPGLGDFSGLPPLLFQVGSTEILLDDSRLAVEKARDAGTEATVEIWADMPHVWHIWSLPESRRAIAHLADFIRQHCP